MAADQYLTTAAAIPWSQLDPATQPARVRDGYAAGSGLTLTGTTFAVSPGAFSAGAGLTQTGTTFSVASGAFVAADSAFRPLNAASAPFACDAPSKAGTIYMDTTLGWLRYCTGSAWSDIGASSSAEALAGVTRPCNGTGTQVWSGTAWGTCLTTAFTQFRLQVLANYGDAHISAGELQLFDENGALIPTVQTSATSPNLIATSSEHDTGIHAAWRMFDGDFDTRNAWHGGAGVASAYVQITFPSAKRVSRYKIWSMTNWNNTPTSDLNRSPKTWQLLGSNDGSSWTVLDARTDTPRSAWPAYSTFNEYSLSPSIPSPNTRTTPYSRWRLSVFQNHGDQNLAIGELQLFDPSNAQVSNAQTSATSPNQILTSAQIDAGQHSGWSVFDGSISGILRGWHTPGGTQFGYIQTTLPSPLAVSKYRIYSLPTWGNGWAADSDRAPRDWQLMGSNDGRDWTVVDQRQGVSNGLWTTYSTFAEFTVAP